MLEGDVLVEKKLGPKGTPPGLVANIPTGMRALAIDVTEQSGVSGFILPGHHVDVSASRTPRKNDDPRRDDPAGRARAGGRPGFHPPRGTRGPVANGHPGAQARRRRHPGRRPGAAGPSRSRCAASTTTTWSSSRRPSPRSTPRPRNDGSSRKRRARRLEDDLRLLKEELARKPRRAQAPAPPPAPRIATIYRGNPQRRAGRGTRSTRRDRACARPSRSMSPETTAIGHAERPSAQGRSARSMTTTQP